MFTLRLWILGDLRNGSGIHGYLAYVFFFFSDLGKNATAAVGQIR